MVGVQVDLSNTTSIIRSASRAIPGPLALAGLEPATLNPRKSRLVEPARRSALQKEVGSAFRPIALRTLPSSTVEVKRKDNDTYLSNWSRRNPAYSLRTPQASSCLKSAQARLT